MPQAGQPSLRLLARVGVVDPTSLDDYRASGGFRALERARTIGTQAVIDEVTASGLVGRGGAAFPTGRKWAAVAAQAAEPHYLVCNADESEPGTFKDRVLMEYDPFAVVEAMAIEAFAVGADKAYLYIRGEYPLAEARIANAIAATTAAGLLGDLDIELRRGAGAYICGEETALFESIEGKRGEPRNKPPFPVEVGLFGKPTAVNNVETLVNVLLILADNGGPDAFRAIGTEGSTGPKLFCVSGNVARPGVYEVEFGATLRELLELAGGIAGGRDLKAVLLGGAAGVFVGPDALDTPLTFEATRAIGATLGSGVVMAFDETADMVDTLRRIAQFFRDESCGQCVPCRVGTVRQEELLARLAAAAATRQPQGRARAAGGNRPGDARCEHLRPGSDRVIGDRERDASAGIGGAVSDGLSMDRDPAPDRRSPHEHEAPAAQPLTEIILKPAARPSRPPAPPPEPPRPAVEISIDGAAVSVPAGSTILDACRAEGIDTPTLCYLENLTPVNVCRVCVVEVKGSRVLVPGLLAQGRGRHGGLDRLRSRPPQPEDGPRVPRLVGRPVDRARGRRLHRPLRRRRRSLRDRGAARGSRRTRRPRAGPPPGPDRRGGAEGPDRRPAGQGRQRPVRPRLLEMHPLLQVRRGLRRGCPEHIRDRRRGARLRRPHLDRGGGPAAQTRPASTAGTASASARPAR